MIFELLFLALFFASLALLIGAVILMNRGARRSATKILLSLGAGWAVYLAIVALVSAATPQRIVPIGQDRCFDDMCFAVVHAETVSQLGTARHPVTAKGVFRVVAVRVSNRARGRAMREAGLRALLWSDGEGYGVSPEGQRAWEAANGQTAALTARLDPGASILSVQVFDLPQKASSPGLVLSHGLTPGYFVIGESPILRKPTLMKIDP
ncbi:MAG: hypothetical protein KGL37_08190 [Acidobacteriota bacterium]|nr:hypothetical protein [Acidobacteriota bacterium]